MDKQPEPIEVLFENKPHLKTVFRNLEHRRKFRKNRAELAANTRWRKGPIFQK